jgi:hypothetical protein
MIIRPEAEADLAEARDYYESHREGLGTEFMRSVEETLGRVSRLPESHPIIYNDKGNEVTLVKRFEKAAK